MILGTKGLDARPPISAPELKTMFMQADDMAKQAQDGVPIQLSMGDFLRLVAMMKRYHDLTARAVALHVPAAADEISTPMDTLVREMKALLELQPQVIQEPPKSRLILPR